MSIPFSGENRRILIIDDNQTIHDDIGKVLNFDDDPLPGWDGAEWGLGKPVDKTSKDRRPTYELSSALQGEAGVALAEAAERAGQPFAMAFVDGRMPPGYDGIETCRRLWECAPDLQIVFCSAYTDHNWDDIRRALGQRRDLIILRKPFEIIEVQQLAEALTTRWSELRSMRSEIEALRHSLDQAPECCEPVAEPPLAALGASTSAQESLISESLSATALHTLVGVLARADSEASTWENSARSSRVSMLTKLSKLLREHRAHLGLFGEKLPTILAEVAGHLESDRTECLTSARKVRHDINLAQIALGVAPPRPPAAAPSSPPAASALMATTPCNF